MDATVIHVHAARQTSAKMFGVSAFALIVLLSSATYLGLCVAALITQQVLYADGAFFAFLTLVRHPWALFLSDYPARAAASLVMLGPASVGRRWLGLDIGATVLVYQITILAFPAAMTALTAALLPRVARVNVMTVVLAMMVGLALGAFAFPTEAVIGVSALCPTLILFLFPRRGFGPWLLLTALSVLVTFSHEGLVLCFPVVLAAAWRGWKRAEPSLRPWILAGAALFLVTAMAAVAVAVTATYSNPLIAKSMASNAHLLGLATLLTGLNPAFFPCLAVFLFWPLSVLTANRLLKTIALVLAGCVMVYDICIMRQEFFPSFNYHIRAYIVFLAPVFLAVMVLMAYKRRPFLAKQGLAFFTILVITQVAHEVVFLGRWNVYKAAFLETLRASGPTEIPVSDFVARLGPLADAPELGFAWLMPYQSMVLDPPAPVSPQRVIISKASWFVPFDCRDRPTLQQDKPPEVDPAVYAAILGDVCRKNTL